MKYYLIAGEASGDLHGGNRIRRRADELTDRSPQVGRRPVRISAGR